MDNAQTSGSGALHQEAQAAADDLLLENNDAPVGTRSLLTVMYIKAKTLGYTQGLEAANEIFSRPVMRDYDSEPVDKTTYQSAIVSNANGYVMRRGER